MDNVFLLIINQISLLVKCDNDVTDSTHAHVRRLIITIAIYCTSWMQLQLALLSLNAMIFADVVRLRHNDNGK